MPQPRLRGLARAAPHRLARARRGVCARAERRHAEREQIPRARLRFRGACGASAARRARGQ